MEHLRKTYCEGDLKGTAIGQFEGHELECFDWSKMTNTKAKNKTNSTSNT